MSPGPARAGERGRRAGPRRRLTAARSAAAALDLAQAFADFAHHYPGLLHAPGLWPTQDGVVPWRAFLALLSARRAHEARAQLQLTGALTLAIGMTFGGREAQAEAARALDRLLRAAQLEE